MKFINIIARALYKDVDEQITWYNSARKKAEGLSTPILKKRFEQECNTARKLAYAKEILERKMI